MAGTYKLVRKYAITCIFVCTILFSLLLVISCEMERESNDGFPGNEIPDSNQISGNITYDAFETDKDYFYIQLLSGKYEFTLENLTADLQLMLYIYDGSWQLVTTLPLSDNTGTSNETIEYTGNNVFYAVLLVEGSGDHPPTQTGQYLLKVSEVGL